MGNNKSRINKTFVVSRPNDNGNESIIENSDQTVAVPVTSMYRPFGTNPSGSRSTPPRYGSENPIFETDLFMRIGNRDAQITVYYEYIKTPVVLPLTLRPSVNVDSEDHIYEIPKNPTTDKSEITYLTMSSGNVSSNDRS